VPWILFPMEREIYCSVVYVKVEHACCVLQWCLRKPCLGKCTDPLSVHHKQQSCISRWEFVYSRGAVNCQHWYVTNQPTIPWLTSKAPEGKKGKVSPVLKCHTVKMYGEVEVELYTFLTLLLCGGEWSFSCSSHFTQERSLQCILDQRLKKTK
jgi:hypothetical protein